jgi:hypothetical protein
MTMTDTGTAARRGRPRSRRLRFLLTALAAVVAILAGYAVWTNVRPYTLQASIRINATPHTLPMFRAMDAALAREVGDHGQAR